MKSKTIKLFWYVIGISALLLFLLILVSSVIDIGQKLRDINLIVEYVFYGVVVILIFFGIINPIRIIISSPSLSIVTSTDQKSAKVYSVYKKMARNIVKHNDLQQDQISLLTNYKSYEELLFNLQTVFEQKVKSQLNNIIIRNAKIVMISTAICQSSRFDMISVFSINLKMIKELVVKCGFRPSMKNLSKLTLNVMSTALIAEGLENMSLEDVIPASAMNSLAEIPFIKPLIESVTQGMVNALMTVRIGMVTRKYLFRDGAVVTKEDIRRQALRESLKLFPLVVSDTITFFPKKIVRFFTKKDDNEPTLEKKPA